MRLLKFAVGAASITVGVTIAACVITAILIHEAYVAIT